MFFSAFLIESSPSSVFAASGSDVIENWDVVDANSPKSDSRFYLNVCHKVIQAGGAAGCPVIASFCAVGEFPQAWRRQWMNGKRLFKQLL